MKQPIFRTKEEMIAEFALKIERIGNESPRHSKIAHTLMLPFEFTCLPVRFVGTTETDVLIGFYNDDVSKTEPCLYAFRSDILACEQDILAFYKKHYILDEFESLAIQLTS